MSRERAYLSWVVEVTESIQFLSEHEEELPAYLSRFLRRQKRSIANELSKLLGLTDRKEKRVKRNKKPHDVGSYPARRLRAAGRSEQDHEQTKEQA